MVDVEAVKIGVWQRVWRSSNFAACGCIGVRYWRMDRICKIVAHPLYTWRRFVHVTAPLGEHAV